jgi:hypothetical protein
MVIEIVNMLGSLRYLPEHGTIGHLVILPSTVTQKILKRQINKYKINYIYKIKLSHYLYAGDKERGCIAPSHY